MRPLPLKQMQHGMHNLKYKLRSMPGGAVLQELALQIPRNGLGPPLRTQGLATSASFISASTTGLAFAMNGSIMLVICAAPAGRGTALSVACAWGWACAVAIFKNCVFAASTSRALRQGPRRAVRVWVGGAHSASPKPAL